MPLSVDVLKRHLNVALLVRLCGTCGWPIGRRLHHGMTYLRVVTPEGPIEWSVTPEAHEFIDVLPLIEQDLGDPPSGTENVERLKKVIAEIDAATFKLAALRPTVQ